MSTNERKPAGILSAADIEAVRARIVDRGMAHNFRATTEALLAHIDALTPPPGELDAEAVMRRAWRKIVPHLKHDTEGARTAVFEAATEATRLGYAAGRLAGEARPPGATCDGCATLRERLAAALDMSRDAVDHVGAVAGNALAAKDAEIARLTDELAEARAAVEQARAEGAKEREACAKSLIDLSNDPFVSRRMDLVGGILAAVEHLRARGAR